VGSEKDDKIPFWVQLILTVWLLGSITIIAYGFYSKGYRSGQLDAYNGKWAYGMVKSESGEITWKESPHAK